MAIRTISGIPESKLKDVIKDLEYEFGNDNIVKVSPQSDGSWRVEYSDEPTKSASFAGITSAFRRRS